MKKEVVKANQFGNLTNLSIMLQAIVQMTPTLNFQTLLYSSYTCPLSLDIISYKLITIITVVLCKKKNEGKTSYN